MQKYLHLLTAKYFLDKILHTEETGKPGVLKNSNDQSEYLKIKITNCNHNYNIVTVHI